MAEPSKDQGGAPTPEVLHDKADDSSASSEGTNSSSVSSPSKAKRRRGSYRPSHKATFIGLAVVIIILGINATVVAFIIKGQDKKIKTAEGQVTISQSALDKIGVNSAPVGDSGIVLTVNPDAKFGGTVTVAGNVSIGGKLSLNNTFSATSASFTQLQAGNTQLQQLNVNGNGTLTSLALRSNLAVTGTTTLQGPTTLSNILTVNSNENVSGNLSVGGTLSVGTFHTSSLVSDYGLTFGGHVITEGSAPGVSAGGAVGSNGTVSISGNDASGTVAVNAGVGAGNGIVAYVSFRNAYTNTPHVIVTPVGPGADDVYVNRSATGFSIGVGSLTDGGHAFDYIVEQ